MSKILTVEEEFDKFKETIDVYETDDNGGLFESKVKQFAIEFAKMHVTAALLPDDTEVIPMDNTAQGIFTIGDIKNSMIKEY